MQTFFYVYLQIENPNVRVRLNDDSEFFLKIF